jgi:hypothetical protein
MSDEEDIAALVVDNGSGMCKGALRRVAGEGFSTEVVRVADAHSQTFR